MQVSIVTVFIWFQHIFNIVVWSSNPFHIISDKWVWICSLCSKRENGNNHHGNAPLRYAQVDIHNNTSGHLTHYPAPPSFRRICKILVRLDPVLCTVLCLWHMVNSPILTSRGNRSILSKHIVSWQLMVYGPATSQAPSVTTRLHPKDLGRF